MKIELTDKQIDIILEEISIEKLSNYLAKDPKKCFTLIKYLLYTRFNTEKYITKLLDFLEKIPIQKELF